VVAFLQNITPKVMIVADELRYFNSSSDSRYSKKFAMPVCNVTINWPANGYLLPIQVFKKP
jgi:hypothetical protein